ncbi:DUF1499 domain-containing protein [Leucothrix sargassi]|nr:DUF1499 domain-containing protein [Leucothrix sargassi]
MTTKSSRLGTLLLLGALLAAIAIGLIMFGARLGFWEPTVGFGIIRNYLNPVGYAVTGLAVLGLLIQFVTRNGKGVVKTLIATLIGVGLLSPMIYGKLNPQPRLPPINDVTTNTSNPPAFLVLDDTRAGAKNSLVYGGEKVAETQKKLYPEIAPIQTSQSPSAAYAKALSIAKASGWEIIAEDADAMRFEATATTSVYAFKDDIVVVVAALDSGSQVDIRSISRIGRSDKGVNAARVKAFIKAFGS